jgi:hypothetical protein
MKLSRNSFNYLFYYIVLPPKLPQEDNNARNVSEWKLDRNLHLFVQEQWQFFVNSAPPNSTGGLDVIGHMLSSWLEVDKQDSICKDTLARIISNVKIHGMAPSHAFSQNLC